MYVAKFCLRERWRGYLEENPIFFFLKNKKNTISLFVIRKPLGFC